MHLQLMDEKPPVFVAIVLDITERKRITELIEHQATFDALTNLPNRRLLLDRMNHAVACCRRHGHWGAVLFIDLDNFKPINDTLGHTIGDALLQEVGRRLKKDLREEDTSARFGGDEFVVLLTELSDDPEQAPKLAQLASEKIRTALSLPYTIQDHTLHLTPSIGIALIPMAGETADDILKHADTAMYRAKEAGRNSVRFYLPSMQIAARQRLKLQNDLQTAIERSEFYLCFQPQVDASGTLVGAEALLRWQHPERGSVPPDNFVHVAEETRQILDIGGWVLHHGLNRLKTWTDEISEYPFQNLAINVSPLQFKQADFTLRIERILAETGAKPEYLILELTEGVLVENVEDATNKMRKLKQLGIRFSIDDFGTGYSSLAYLKRLPVDGIKIDRSFVSDITTDPDDANLVETIITMAEHLGLEVVAEGVETEEQLEFLRDRGCRLFQGYYFGRPLSEEGFTELLVSTT
jgi:diguanylate cyclase (GGDEF)-like protein